MRRGGVTSSAGPPQLCIKRPCYRSCNTRNRSRSRWLKLLRHVIWIFEQHILGIRKQMAQERALTSLARPGDYDRRKIQGDWVEDLSKVSRDISYMRNLKYQLIFLKIQTGQGRVG